MIINSCFRNMMGPGGYGYGPPSNPLPQQYPSDPYSSPMRDPYYNGSPYEQQQSPYSYRGPSGYSPGYGTSYGGPPGPNMSPHHPATSPYGASSYMTSSPTHGQQRGAPFRLHDQQQQPQPPMKSYSSPMSPIRSTAALPMSSPGSRKSSNEAKPPEPQPRLHTSVPAPEEDDMAPQNVSFIDSSADDGGDEADNAREGKSMSPTPVDALKRLPERLSQLNISSGSKTYRVHSSSDKESPSPSPTRNTRPTISSTFKQNRRGSGGESSAGPASLRSNQPETTFEEEEALANMKTERLKDDKDAAAGFVISFDDDSKPKKPKPMLKERRLSSKKASMTEFSSDGSNSSRKENVPPEVMICIVSSTPINIRWVGINHVLLLLS